MTPPILLLMIDVAFVAFLFLSFVAMATAAATLSHHHEKECADRQVPEDVCQCRVHNSPRLVVSDDTHGRHLQPKPS